MTYAGTLTNEHQKRLLIAINMQALKQPGFGEHISFHGQLDNYDYWYQILKESWGFISPL